MKQQIEKYIMKEQGIDNLIWYKSLIINIYWALLIIFFFLLLWNGFIFVPRYIFYLLLYICISFCKLIFSKKNVSDYGLLNFSTSNK